MPNVVAIVQARMNSTRLHGKVLKEILSKPLLEYQIERVQKSKLINNIVIATTTNSCDDVIVKLCNKLNCSFYRGSELDVLQRYHESAKYYQADVVVRLTSDCPVIDPEVIDLVIEHFTGSFDGLDYAANIINRTFPRGMDVEVFTIDLLEKLTLIADSQKDREHVTSYILSHPNQFKTTNILYSSDFSHCRLTVDTIDDFNLIKLIIEYLYPKKPDFTLEDVLTVLDENPSWIKLNAHIEQKKY